MIRIPLPLTDAHLLLTPRWGELATPAQIVLLVLLLAVPVLLVLWLYRYELRLVSRMSALGLLLLRLAVLAVILTLVGFQPVFARTHVEELPGRVVIAVDRSASTTIADTQRPTIEKLRLARALRLTDVPTARLSDWIAQYQQHDRVAFWVGEDEARDDATKRQRLEEERRAQYAGVLRAADALTRGETARRVLADDGAGLLATIAARHKVELLGFATETWDTTADDLAATPAQGTGATDLRMPLSRALERSAGGDGKVLGVVLLTDGQHNLGTSPVKKAIELGDHQLPIFPVMLGSRLSPPDVALVSVKAPPAVFRDVDTTIEARIKVSGLRDRKPITVVLERPDEKPLEETIAHDGADRFHTVRFQVRLEKPGQQALTVTAKPAEGEVTKENNSRSVVINVADDKAKVLMVDGEARWEFHYLSTALQRDRTMEPRSVVFSQPRLGSVPEDELRKTGNPWLTMPVGADALSGYDAIILGDVTPAQLPPPERARLEKYVADRGGTLVILAGKRSMPLAFLGSDEPLARLLPIEKPRILNLPSGFGVTLSYDGKTTPFLQMEPEPDRNEARWTELARHFWGVVGVPKPGATTLAYVPEGMKNAATAEKEQAIIVRQNYGFGRVLFVGLDSTWRWRFRVGDTYHHRFWGQTIRWAAAEKPLVTGNEHVRFGTRDAVYRPGQEVEVVVRLSEETTPLPADALAAARILRLRDGGAEEAVAVVPLVRRDAQPRVLDGKLRDLPPGRYAIELAVPDLADRLLGPPGEDGQARPLRATFTVAASDGDEMVELAANAPLLEELAAKSNGKVFTPDDLAGLVDALTQRAVRREERAENRLWQWWVLLVLIVTLLTLEWVGRKWAGLP